MMNIRDAKRSKVSSYSARLTIFFRLHQTPKNRQHISFKIKKRFASNNKQSDTHDFDQQTEISVFVAAAKVDFNRATRVK